MENCLDVLREWLHENNMKLRAENSYEKLLRFPSQSSPWITWKPNPWNSLLTLTCSVECPVGRTCLINGIPPKQAQTDGSTITGTMIITARFSIHNTLAECKRW